MLIRAGYDISFETEVPTPMLAMLSIHPSRHKDLRTPHRIVDRARRADLRLSSTASATSARALTVPAGRPDAVTAIS